MTTPIDTQTKINDVYRIAILAAFSSNNAPLTNADLSTLITGGVEPAEVMNFIKEPYVPVLVSLIANGTLACWHDDEGRILYDLYTRVEEADSRTGRVQAQEFISESFPSEGGFNDPSNWRSPVESVISEIASDMADRTIRAIMEDGGITEHEVLH